MRERKQITEEVIGTFLEGHDPMERIVGLEYKYTDDKIKVLYRDANDRKKETMDYFHPFCWATQNACNRLCNGDRRQVSALMSKYGIRCKKLDTRDTNGVERKEFADGYLYMFHTTKATSYKNFLKFFEEAGNPIYSKGDDNMGGKRSKQYLMVTPQEQYMIATGRRFFKGYDDYDQLLRLIFDLETGGLDPKRHRINQLGVRFNRPIKTKTGVREYSQIFSLKGETEEEKNQCELELITIMIKMVNVFEPDIVTAHNGENFDWWFIEERCIVLGTTLEELSHQITKKEGIKKKKKETILKLGGEIETFFQTVIPGSIATDSLHAVRRAQALDSNMERADLKYVTKYSKIVKPNRVYVPGDKIAKVWSDTASNYAFNNTDGDWYHYDPKHASKASETSFRKGMDPDKGKFTMYTRNFVADGYQLVSGKYIVERYLEDDLWECDKVENRYNTPNFLICKMLPVPFQKCCTMGTAGQWKAIMLAWSYENDLAIPMFGESKTFTGGISRLLVVGVVDRVAKLDYNSLYPSITLTWDISDPTKDLMGAMLFFLEYVLLGREKYKGLMKKAGKLKDKLGEQLKGLVEGSDEYKELSVQMLKAAEEESANDKKQLPLKVFGNSFFGSYGAPNVYPFGSLVCAERITCTGRMCLRLMISHFKKLGYRPIVGDSFTGDTPIFVKHKDTGYIDILPVAEVFNAEKREVDVLGREYDYSEKPYLVLCRSGWVECEYVYRHKTDKKLYRVTDGKGMVVDVTEDHSLYDRNRNEIKPSQISKDTELEYYGGSIKGEVCKQRLVVNYKEIIESVVNGELDRFPVEFLNFPASYYPSIIHHFNKCFDGSARTYSKTFYAQMMYMYSKLED